MVMLFNLRECVGYSDLWCSNIIAYIVCDALGKVTRIYSISHCRDMFL
jgi:hypothetical protein